MAAFDLASSQKPWVAGTLPDNSNHGRLHKPREVRHGWPPLIQPTAARRGLARRLQTTAIMEDCTSQETCGHGWPPLIQPTAARRGLARRLPTTAIMEDCKS